jgi:hypothetical protein
MQIGLGLSLTMVRAGLSGPVMLVAPAILGGGVASNTLTSYLGAWSAGTVVTSRWLLDAVASGTGSTLATATGDAGKVPGLEVTGTKNGRSTVVTVTRAALITEAAAKTTFVSALTSAGITSKLDAVYCFASSTRALAKVNLLNPGTNDATEVGTAPTFTAFLGFRSAASGSYIASIDPTSGTFKFLQNDNSFALRCMTDVASNNSTGGWDTTLINPKVSPDTYRTRNGSTTSNSITGEVDARGISLVTRRASTGYYKYRDGECIGVSNGLVTQTSSALSAGALRFCAWGDASPSNLYDNTRFVGSGLVGGGLTETEVLAYTAANGLLMNQLGAVAPEVTRLQSFFGDTPDKMIFAGDVKWAYEAGTKTRCMVTTAADTGFATPVWTEDLPLTKTGIYGPFKHTATGLTPGTAYIAQVLVVRP